MGDIIMASSNRHWPSMFKSKPCNTHHHHQWQHDINSSLMSSGCHRAPYASVTGCEERSPEPKPRWNPKPEQIRILEAIFNSGMINPPREEIRKIRAQLQEYGQVGDANVFYWFQNRKSRSKHKLRHLQNTKEAPQQAHQIPPITSVPTTITAPSSSSSSSSERSSPKGSNRAFSLTTPSIVDATNSPTNSVNQTYFHAHSEFLTEPFFFPLQEQTGGGSGGFTQGFCYSELTNVLQAPDQLTIGPCTSLLLSEIMNHGGALKKEHEEKTMKIQPQLHYTVTTAPITQSIVPPTPATTTVTVPSTNSQIQGAGDPGVAPRSTVFINDVAFEVSVGPFNVREAFGEDAVLIHSSGQPVFTNEWGVTLQPLQHGAIYYLVM
ncbi:Homeobox domain-containing protein [Cephalotus follicularis]|uniref:Homeobox domain-containing protein n=1 Tax=Cephalotus follicularis TaxID=3775 RepID=A0A1Q3C9R3_CEPFO|nr:Homeobox domain-containing protein [Cephalotus follicularis]